MELDKYDQAIQASMNDDQNNQNSSETTDSSESQEPTEEQSVQEGVSSANGEGTPNWNPQEFSFKADGQVRTARSREELLSLASLGYHYNVRAQKLNQREAALYQREQALQTQTQQPQQQEEFNPFLPQKDQHTVELENRLSQMEQQFGSYTAKQQEADTAQYSEQVEDFAGALTNDYGLAKEEIDEFIWDAMRIADKFEDIDDLKAYFFKTHPDAPEKRAKRIAEQDISKFKKSMSRNTVVNSTTVGNTPVSKAKIDSYESAYNAASRDPRIGNAKGIQ
jgi:hypothetical protein